MKTYIFQIEGMRCNNCKRNVENVINSQKGLSGEVNLEEKKCIVKSEGNIDTEFLKSEIEDLGFDVVSVFED